MRAAVLILLAASLAVAQERVAEAPVEGLARRANDAIVLTLPHAAKSEVVLHGFRFEGDPVANSKLHFKQLADGVVEVTSVAFESGEWSFAITDGADLYGFGARGNDLNAAGSIVRTVKTDGKGQTTQNPVPFFFSRAGYGLWIDTVTPVTADAGVSQAGEIGIAVSTQKLRLVLFQGPEYAAVLKRFAEAASHELKIPEMESFTPRVHMSGGAADAGLLQRMHAAALPAVSSDDVASPLLAETSAAISFSPEDGLARSLRAALNAGLSGIPLWRSVPVGAPSNLYAAERWTELACFEPMMQVLDPQQMGEDALAAERRYVALHASLLPYRVRAAQLWQETGLPVMRALAMVYTDDAMARAATDEYLFGPDLLVAPVLNAGTQRPVYLPVGNWINLWTGAEEAGRRTDIVDAPYDTIPAYARSGSVIAKLLEDAPAKLDERRVYELMPGFRGEAVASKDFEGRTLTRDAHSFKVEGKDAKVTVRWRFGRVINVTVNGSPARVEHIGDAQVVEFVHAGNTTVAWR